MRHDHLVDEIEPKAFDRRLLARLLVYLRPYAWQVALAVLLLFGASLLALAGPYLVKVAIDDHIAAGDLAGIDRVALLFLGASLGVFALRYAQTVLTFRIGQRAMLDLRLQVFARVQEQPLAYFDRTPVGRLMTRVGSDVEVLQELFSSGAVNVFGDLFTVVGVVAAMLILAGFELPAQERPADHSENGPAPPETAAGSSVSQGGASRQPRLISFECGQAHTSVMKMTSFTLG